MAVYVIAAPCADIAMYVIAARWSGYGCVIATQCAVRAVLQPHIRIRTRSCSRNPAAAAGQSSYCRSLSNHEKPYIFVYKSVERELGAGDGRWGWDGWVGGRIIAALALFDLSRFVRA